MIDRDHNALDLNPFALLTRQDWIAIALGFVLIAIAVTLIGLWLFSTPADANPNDRPDACAAYSGAEVAACIAEAR